MDNARPSPESAAPKATETVALIAALADDDSVSSSMQENLHQCLRSNGIAIRRREDAMRHAIAATLSILATGSLVSRAPMQTTMTGSLGPCNSPTIEAMTATPASVATKVKCGTSRLTRIGVTIGTTTMIDVSSRMMDTATGIDGPV
jgi:hypothetical protein